MSALRDAVPEISQPAPYRRYSFLAPERSFSADVHAGLALHHKVLEPAWFFDPQGLQLFRAMAVAPEFYLAKAEASLLGSVGAEIAALTGPDALLMGLGAGGMVSLGVLIGTLRPALYLQVDVDAPAIDLVARELASHFDWLSCAGIVADVVRPLVLPEFVGRPLRRKVLALPAWTLASYTADSAFVVLQNARRMVGTGGMVVAGIGLKKSRKVLNASCNDSAGASAAFNGHILERINHDLAGDFQLPRFRHLAFYDEVKGRVEMYLESQAAQMVQVEGRRYRFEAGEAILSGIQSKYSDEEFVSYAGEAGFVSQKMWTDEARQVSLHALMAV
jgi:dimethylhistidine N-methyltransferase